MFFANDVSRRRWHHHRRREAFGASVPPRGWRQTPTDAVHPPCLLTALRSLSPLRPSMGQWFTTSVSGWLSGKSLTRQAFGAEIRLQTTQTSAPAVRIVDIAITSPPQTMSGGVAANRMTGRSQRPGKASNGQAEIGRKRRVWDFRHYRSNVSNRTVDHTSRRRSGSPEQRGTRVNCRTKPRFLESADQFALSIGSCGRRNSSGAQTGLESEDRLAGMPSLVRCRQRCGPSPWERSRQGGCR